MRQRLGLAQALLGKPRALLLDEPTTGLDPVLRQSFYEIIGDLRQDGAMVLLSSHALAELEGHVDRVVVMNQGRKVADGSLADLRRLAVIRPRIRLRLPRAPRAVANGPDCLGRLDKGRGRRDGTGLRGRRVVRRIAQPSRGGAGHRDYPAVARRPLCSIPEGDGMRQVLIIAGKELRDGMRNRWVLATTVLLAALALTLAFLGAAPTGSVKLSALAVTIVSLSSLSIFLVPLIALLLSYDAIVGEVDRGTMALLLAYPVARWQVVVGKFAGHLGHPGLRDRGRLRHRRGGAATGRQ